MNTDERFTKAFLSYFAGNKGPEGQIAEYGISASGNESTGSVDLKLIFKKASRYCCYEWGCHIGIQRPGGWNVLKQCFSKHNIHFQSNITIHLIVIVESGAIILCNQEPVSKSIEYSVTIHEAPQITTDNEQY